MKSTSFLFLLAASSLFAQSGTAKKTAHPAAKTTVTHHAASTRAVGEIPPLHGVVKTLFSERYEDYKIGTGPLAEPNKLYKVEYTGYLAATGQKFDSSYDHRTPEIKDGKPVMGPDGKPVLGPAQPFLFPQGYGRLIPGFDEGFVGMHVGGKRRIFIPWQLAYGTRDIPARPPDHPGIPPKSDLIFDVELLEVTDMPQMPQRPMGMPPRPGAPSGHAVPPSVRPGAAEPSAATPAGSAPAQPEAKPAPPDSNAPPTK